MLPLLRRLLLSATSNFLANPTVLIPWTLLNHNSRLWKALMVQYLVPLWEQSRKFFPS